MHIQISGWKKVYFFYGLIFFGLGLIGFFFNNRLSLSRVAQLALVNLSKELSDLGLLASGESREVTVFNLRSRSIVIIYPDSIGDSQSNGLKERILYRMGAGTQVVSYRVSERDWFKSPQSEWLLSDDRFVIGLDPNAVLEGLEGPSILFSLSKPMAVEFVNRLLNHQPEFPLFKLELIWRGQTFLYGLSFGKSGGFSSCLKATDILLDLWETGGRNLLWGNYRETF